MSDCVNPLVVDFTQKMTESLQPRINRGCSAETASTTTLNPIFRLKRFNMALEKLNFVSSNYIRMCVFLMQNLPWKKEQKWTRKTQNSS